MMIDLIHDVPQPLAAEQTFSVGYACQFLRILPADLFAVMQAQGVQFVRSVDGVGYLTGEDLQTVASALQAR